MDGRDLAVACLPLSHGWNCSSTIGRALRARSGVGEYVHKLLAALADPPESDERLHLFTSSWGDRLQKSALSSLPGVVAHHARVPVRVLNWAQHRLGWPPVDRVAGGHFDTLHAAHPLLIPARGARVVHVHDLDFLDHPERTSAEIRRGWKTPPSSEPKPTGQKYC